MQATQASTFAAPSDLSSVRAPSARPRALPALMVLSLFLPFSLWVMYQDGLVGLFRVTTREPWGAQLLVDLGISCFVAGTWMVGDARQRKLTVWPFVVATALMGSIGLLGYYVRRSFSDAPAR